MQHSIKFKDPQLRVLLIYAEACHAESDRDFLHKMKLVMKELAETKQWLGLLAELEFSIPRLEFQSAWTECDELCPIIFSAIRTKERNMGKENRSDNNSSKGD